jgi:DNA-binding transcriptional MerR regulator
MRNDLFDVTDVTSITANDLSSSPYLPAIPIPFDLPDEPLPIADVADLFGVTHRTLHFYEEKGLLRASRAGPMRVYFAEQIRRMAIINACREIGIGILVIQELMEELAAAGSQEEADEIFRIALARRKRELTADISHIHRQMQQIETLMTCEGEEHPQNVRGPVSPILTEVERQCLSLMAEGYSPPRLARTLHIEFDDLRRIEADIMEKFQATNRFQAVAKAVLLGVVLN